MEKVIAMKKINVTGFKQIRIIFTFL